MNKNFKIWGVRFSLAGDLVMALPVLNYLEIKYPNSYKYWVIAKKCSQFSSIFLNHPLIDSIRITEGEESLGSRDCEIMNSCNLILNIAPQHPDGMPTTTKQSCWWNFFNIYQETFRMAGFNVEEYQKLPIDLQYSKLEKWFDTPKINKTIAIFPFTSYGLNARSPSVNWWHSMVEKISKLGYTIFHFGGEKEPDINSHHRLTDLTIFEQIKIALGCDLVINTNSGSGLIMGAYGKEQITLLTNDAPGHFQNPLAFAPLNYKNNNINIFQPGGCDKINQDLVLESIKQLCS